MLTRVLGLLEAGKGWWGLSAVLSGWSGSRSLPSGRKAWQRSTRLPRGLQGAIKNMPVLTRSAKTHSWKVQGHLHAAESP